MAVLKRFWEKNVVLKNRIDYRINIIIPVYNGEKYIRQTIKSVLKAGKGEVQIILIDDGSTDQSRIICEKYQEQFDNILYFRK